MTTTVYLVFNESGFVAAKKTNQFNLDAGQRAIAFEVTIPNEAFEPHQMMRVSANVPVEMVLRPAVDVLGEPRASVGVLEEPT